LYFAINTKGEIIIEKQTIGFTLWKKRHIYLSVVSNFRMIHLFCINILAIAFCLITVFTSCGQSQNKKTDQTSKSVQVDTSKTAIIPFDKKDNYPFNNSFNSTTLTQDDINTIDSLFIVCVTDYNKLLDKNHKEWRIDLEKYNYYKQIIAVINKKGDKEVWVNCFCYTWNNDNWKKEILLVHDGGNCYFNFKLNLATKICYDLTVNGEA
jgi:hypothetical protein